MTIVCCTTWCAGSSELRLLKTGRGLCSPVGWRKSRGGCAFLTAQMSRKPCGGAWCLIWHTKPLLSGAATNLGGTSISRLKQEDAFGTAKGRRLLMTASRALTGNLLDMPLGAMAWLRCLGSSGCILWLLFGASLASSALCRL